MEFDMHAVMERLAVRRPIFHSEADFQFALAWEIKEMHACEVRLEYPIESSDGRRYLDICLPTEGVAIELKYPVYNLRHELNDEAFDLRESSKDNARYDYIKDIQRLERLASRGERFARGFAVLLTNAPLLWMEPVSTNNDHNFVIYEGRTLTGKMDWVRPRPQKDKERHAPLSLAEAYDLRWNDYSMLPEAGVYAQFRYLVVEAN